MSDTAVSLLTPPGTGAIATVGVHGPRAWELARQLFKPAGKPLPESPEVGRFWFGTLGRDEVVLAATAADAIEVHCHGGQRVVRWVVEQFTSQGCNEERTPRPPAEGFVCARAAELLPHAPTLRTASILLDQAHGAFANEVRRILHTLETQGIAAKEPLRRLCRFGYSVGRHLIEPWKVVVAGPPNVGKSSLVNAIAGYQRAVVSEVAGTTRDAVSVRTAFDGWPIELIDTAGLRHGAGLEAEGIELARRAQAEADLLLWVLDVSDPEPVPPNLRELGATLPAWCVIQLVANKSDREWRWSPESMAGSENRRGAMPVSSTTGQGIPELIGAVVGYLAPECPPGSAVPFTDRLINLVCKAATHWTSGEWSQAADCLRETLIVAE